MLLGREAGAPPQLMFFPGPNLAGVLEESLMGWCPVGEGGEGFLPCAPQGSVGPEVLCTMDIGN